MAEVSRSLVTATSSSRFVVPNYWADPNSGVAYQIQVQVPQAKMDSLEQARNVPIFNRGGQTLLLRDVATVTEGTAVGQYQRYNMQRMIAVTANVAGADLGSVAAQLQRALDDLGKPPAGVSVAVRGQIVSMQQMLGGLRTGLLLAVVAIFLLLTANFQSMRLALIVVATAPAVVAGVASALWLTRTTLNIQSFMGAIMAIGVAVANALLLVTFAERSRMAGASAADAAAESARSRLRPILMTSLAMIAGMVPMALGLGEGGQQTAPLGRAVIGGLALATIATLLALPAVYALVQGRANRQSPSLDPDQAGSRTFLAALMLLVMVAGCGKPAANVAPPAAAPLTVVTTTAKTGPITRSVTLPTFRLLPYQSATLYAKVAGYLKTVKVDKGDAVKEGQLLAEIEVPELLADETEFKAEASVARGNYERMAEARRKSPDLVVPQSVDELRGHSEVAQAKLQRTQTLLQFARITAPFAGVITARFADPGAFIPAATTGSTPQNAAMLTLMDFSRIRVQLYVPEAEVPFIKNGLAATLTVEELPGHPFQGTITRFANVLDESTKTMLTEIELANPSGILRPGMYANVRLNVERKASALLVPSEAVVVEKAGTFVYKVADGKAHKMAVHTGFRDATNVEITDGAVAGDQLILVGKQSLTDGQSVTVAKP
jgi:RND family efflux transporter MFP subunit